APTAAAEGGTFVPGTYTGKGTGMNGDVVVSVTFDKDAITSVEVTEHAETEGISDPAIANLPAAILAAQSTQVDAVSGATMTSNGIIAAVNDAITQAGADPAALVPKAAETGGEAAELTADVVVAGGGLAGLSAAVKAAEDGASVILVEKMAMLGGSSALSGGGLGATDTAVQKEAGITDTDASWKQLWEERQATSPEQGMYPDWDRVDRLIATSSDTIDWLLSLGYQFRRPEGFGVDPVERLHFPAPEGNGSVLTGFLGEKAEELGVQILLETPATELIVEDGAVTGLKAENKSGPVTLHAKSVVLATGGFGRSEELTARFTPEVADYVQYSVSGAGNMGDGIVMAEAVGAALYEDPWMIGLGLATPVKEMAGLYWYGTYMLVNQDGERFTNEGDHYAVVYNDAAYQSPGGSYMLFDGTEAFAPFIAAADPKVDNAVVFKADSIEALASAIGADPAKLTATVEAYNKISAGTEDAFGKAAELAVPLKTGPFYAVKYFPCNMGTFGGVKTNEAMEVLTADGTVIKGLYAAGEMANRPYYSQVYMSGSALQVAATTGVTAGTSAAAAAK
ncbi:MAG TPA: FAD-dependent oxidoreductase, partial [Feifaniaceae bacterium]|nr:FAD-dependent oxidoreductase [Feifaniaceae bacterium]